MKLLQKWNMTGKVMINVTIVVLLTPTVLAVKCFECRSNIDPKCKDPFDNSTIPWTDCDLVNGRPHFMDGTPIKCSKIKQKVNGEWSYVRGCAFRGDMGIQDSGRFCLVGPGTYEIEYSTCNDRDGCNSAHKITPTPLKLTLLIGFCCLLKCIPY